MVNFPCSSVLCRSTILVITSSSFSRPENRLTIQLLFPIHHVPPGWRRGDSPAAFSASQAQAYSSSLVSVFNRVIPSTCGAFDFAGYLPICSSGVLYSLLTVVVINLALAHARYWSHTWKWKSNRILCWGYGTLFAIRVPSGVFLLCNVQQSLFFLTQAMTVLHWSKISDKVGRKPVILTGLFGLSVSMYCFGLSRTFWGLVLRYAVLSGFNLTIWLSIAGVWTVHWVCLLLLHTFLLWLTVARRWQHWRS